MPISPKNDVFKARSYHRNRHRFGVTIRVLLGLIAGFMLWQKNGLAHYFANMAMAFLIPNLDAPAIQYAIMSFVVVLGFSACMSLTVMMVFFITGVAHLLLSKPFFSPASSTPVS